MRIANGVNVNRVFHCSHCSKSIFTTLSKGTLDWNKLDLEILVICSTFGCRYCVVKLPYLSKFLLLQ